MSKTVTCVTPPSPPERGNDQAWRILAGRFWTEDMMPKDKRHPETRRNEVFLMNVTPKEFVFLATIFPIGDFKKARLGDVAFATTGNVLEVGAWRPMFGALKTSARKRIKRDKPARKVRKARKK